MKKIIEHVFFPPGLSRSLADDDKPFTTAVYGNGPGYINGSRPVLNTNVTGRHHSLKTQYKISHRALNILSGADKKICFVSGFWC